MPKLHWGSVAIGVALGVFVVPMVLSAVRGLGSNKQAAPAQNG